MNTLSTDFLDVPERSSLLFFPRRCEVTNGLEPIATRAADGALLGGLWLERPGSDGVLLFFHGNGEVAADWSTTAVRYAAALNASVWIADYRGYGLSTGEPSYGMMLADAEHLFEALSERETMRGLPFRRLFVLGRSIGSAAAIHLVWRFSDRVDALIVDSGFARITELVRRFRRLRGLSDVAPEAPVGFLDNIDKLRDITAPTLLLHGDSDAIIPLSEARENLAASPAEWKRLVEIPGAGHNDLLFRAREGDLYFGALRRLAAQ